MSGASITDIRKALAAQLGENLDAETNVSPFGVPKQPPCIMIDNPSGDYEIATHHELSDLELELIIDPAGDDESAVRRVDAYLASGLGNNSSIIDAIDVDPTLGGVVDDCGVKSYRRERETGLTFLRLVIMARRSL